MKTVLITGPIGSGKSEVRRYLESQGYPVYDCDSRTKMLYESVPGLKKEIEERLGVPFSQLGIIFSDESRRLALEEIVYPLVVKDINEWKNSLPEGTETAYIESAVAMEKPMFDSLYDEIWLVDAPVEQRMKRNPKAAERDALQHFDKSRIARFLNNDSTIENLLSQL